MLTKAVWLCDHSYRFIAKPHAGLEIPMATLTEFSRQLVHVSEAYFFVPNHSYASSKNYRWGLFYGTERNGTERNRMMD